MTETIDEAVRAWFAAGPSGPPLALHPNDVPYANEVLAECLRELANSRGVMQPHQLPIAHQAGHLSAEQLTRSWIAAEWPCRDLAAETWIALFRALLPSPQCEPTIEVWRAQVGDDIGLSWTRDRARALWFLRRNVETLRLPGVLLHGYAPAAQVLAVLDTVEREVLVDPSVRFWRRQEGFIAHLEALT